MENDVFQILTVHDISSDGGSPHILSALGPTNNTSFARLVRRGGFGDTIAWLLPDTMKGVFHPKPNGHAYIAALVLYHMEAENAKIQAGVSSTTQSDVWDDWTEMAPAMVCPLQASDLSLAAAIAEENSTSSLPVSTATIASRTAVALTSVAPSAMLSSVVSPAEGQDHLYRH